jgi:hypothetical protein
MLSKCEDDIKTQQRKIDRETKEKQQNWEFVCEMAKAKIDEIKNTIKREQGERQKLLNHENEITRSAAKELYERYLAASESARSRDLY